MSGPVVIFGADPGSGAGSDAGLGRALATHLAEAGTTVVEVAPGPELRLEPDRVVIDPAVREHYEAIFAALDGDGPVHVVHLGGLQTGGTDPADESSDDAELAASLRLGYDSLLLAIQAAGECGREVRLVTVSRGAVEIIGADVTAPASAIVHGLGRSARHEYPDLSWLGVDLEPTADGRLAGDLAAELYRTGAADGPAMVGWRRGRRWVEDWAEAPTPEAGAPVWRAEGTYLITGGTRGLGLALARRLVALGVRRLALVARTAGTTRTGIAELEAAGAEVLLLAADAGRPEELRAALRRACEHFGTLTGVIHAAGGPASGMIRRQSPAGARAVLAPKVLALGPLAELVSAQTPPAERPELLVLYSSAITAFGGIGEGDYCAANSVLDAYGSALAASAPSTRVLTVAWGPWQHDDWQLGGPAGGLAERARHYRARYGFDEDEGCAFLDRLIRTGAGRVVAMRQPMADAQRDWSAMLDLGSLVRDSTTLPPGERFPRPQLRTEFVPARTELETTVAGVWEAYLGIDRIGVHDPFFDLGGNSLLGMAMVHALETALDTQIAPAVLFECPTVAEFAAALGRSNGPDPDGPDANGPSAAQEQLTTSSDRGQRRRRARSDSRK